MLRFFRRNRNREQRGAQKPVAASASATRPSSSYAAPAYDPSTDLLSPLNPVSPLSPIASVYESAATYDPPAPSSSYDSCSSSSSYDSGSSYSSYDSGSSYSSCDSGSSSFSSFD